jgi:2-polyprenyl-3-methyl-5-hydroxy-6-metoxy-1,4-benzoquinol methylase
MTNSRASDYRDRIYAAYASSKGESADVPVAGSTEIRALRARLSNWVPVDPQARCIDVGCGAGLLLAALREWGFSNCEGIDCSVEQVARAQKVSEHVCLGDATDYLASRLETYDLVTAMDIIEHFHKDELLAFLDAARAALKPGGRLIVQTPNAGGPWGMKVRHGDLTHEIALGVESLTQAFRVCGFENWEFRESEPYVHGA